MHGNGEGRIFVLLINRLTKAGEHCTQNVMKVTTFSFSFENRWTNLIFDKKEEFVQFLLGRGFSREVIEAGTITEGEITFRDPQKKVLTTGDEVFHSCNLLPIYGKTKGTPFEFKDELPTHSSLYDRGLIMPKDIAEKLFPESIVSLPREIKVEEILYFDKSSGNDPAVLVTKEWKYSILRGKVLSKSPSKDWARERGEAIAFWAKTPF